MFDDIHVPLDTNYQSVMKLWRHEELQVGVSLHSNVNVSTSGSVGPPTVHHHHECYLQLRSVTLTLTFSDVIYLVTIFKYTTHICTDMAAQQCEYSSNL